MSRREERLARNEAFFRELNERLEAVTPDSAEELVVVCECADEDCVQRLKLQELLGYSVLGLLGNVDGRNPKKYIEDARRVRDGVIEL